MNLYGWAEQTFGAFLILLVLADVFLAVLYARIGTGIVSRKLGDLVWRLFVWAAKRFGRRRGTLLSFCGPAILISVVAVWAGLLASGAALVIHPRLGQAIRATDGPTPTDFLTALYVGGNSMSIVGSTDFVAQTDSFRMFFLANSLIGVTVLSLTLAYLMQIYTALQTRNCLGLKLHLLAMRTKDAAELVARLGPRGDFSGGLTILMDLADGMSTVEELHHFYPVLFYFRFREPYYSVSMSTLLALDTVTLIRTGVSRERYPGLADSGSVLLLWESSLLMVETISTSFLPATRGVEPQPPSHEIREHWRNRYLAALKRMQEAGIETVAVTDAGFEHYVSQRVQWDWYVRKLAPALAYTMEEIDPAVYRQ